MTGIKFLRPIIGYSVFMQKVLIAYYSRTGATKKLATALQDRLGADIVEISCRKYRRGPLRYLLAGYDSVKGNLPPIKMHDIAFDDYGLILLGAPIWTSHPALPLRTFLNSAPTLPARIGLFFTYGGHSPPEKAIAETEALLPGPLVASLALKNAEVLKSDCSAAIATFTEKLAHQDQSLLKQAG